MLAVHLPEYGCEAVGYIDDFNPGDGVLGPLAEMPKRYPPDRFGIVLALGYNNLAARWRAYQRGRALGYSFPTLLHPRAHVGNKTRVGAASIVMAQTSVDATSTLEEAVVVWPGAVVSHDSHIGANTFLSPASTICGFCQIGRDSFIGAGATMVDHSRLGDAAFLKAGAVCKTGRFIPGPQT